MRNGDEEVNARRIQFVGNGLNVKSWRRKRDADGGRPLLDVEMEPAWVRAIERPQVIRVAIVGEIRRESCDIDLIAGTKHCYNLIVRQARPLSPLKSFDRSTVPADRHRLDARQRVDSKRFGPATKRRYTIATRTIFRCEAFVENALIVGSKTVTSHGRFLPSDAKVIHAVWHRRSK